MTQSLTYVEIDVPTFTYRTLLHFDGADASTAIVDSSGSGAVWTVAGNAQIDTAQSQAGGSSLLLDGTGDWVIGPGSVMAVGTSDFSIEFWMRLNATGTLVMLDARATGSSVAISIYVAGTNLRFFTNNGDRISGTTTLTTGTWYRVGLARVSGVTRLYLNGAQEGAAYVDANDYNLANVGSTVIGATTGLTFPFNGWIDELSVVSGVQTFRFATDTAYLPLDITAIPSIKSIDIDPAIVGLGTDVGQRATVTATFKDHKYQFAAEGFNNGTFWGKFRARYGLKLRGRAMRLYRGVVGQALNAMERRLFIIESVDGPAANGEYKIIAKDVLKYADDSRSQAPILSNGFLTADITNVATSASLSPSGIGDAEYPASGVANIGGNEACTFTRSGDTLTLTRGQFNTAAVSHSAGDRVQLCLYYNGQDAANIIFDLLVTYAGVPSGYIAIGDWQAETAGNLGVVYTALLGEPIGVTTLLDELIEQAALAIWWDDVAQLLRLQVLRPVSGSSIFSMDNIMQGSMEIQEQPDKRISQVYVYYGKINPLLQQDQISNFRSTVLRKDAQSEVDYATPSIKKIYCRWIPAGGRTTAQTIANKQLGRYRDPPRRFNFSLMRYAQANPNLGGGYSLQSWQLQTVTGGPASVPIQIFRVNPGPDIWKIEAEEMLWTPYVADVAPNVRSIVFDANENNINLRTRHDQLFPSPISGITINAFINAGIIIGSANTSTPALDIGTWPAGVTVNLTVNGRIQGCGGAGGGGGNVSQATAQTGFNGLPGGPALFTRQNISLVNNPSGQIWSGGGGGGGSGVDAPQQIAGSGGGGGAGTNGGAAGPGGGSTIGPGFGSAGNPGSGGAGGAGGSTVFSPAGGAGGNPGGSGVNGHVGATTIGGFGAAAGAAIDGVSHVTGSGSGSILGSLIN